MEIEVKQRNQRNRRRERAQRMQAQRESKVKDGDSGEDESPAREKPPRPPVRRKKVKEPLGEEDIIDGFAIMAFRTYEDLEAAVKCAASPRTEALSTKPRLADAPRYHPPTTTTVTSHALTLLQDAGTSDDSGRASERLTGSSVAPRDPDSSRDRLSDASSRCSSGKGYICDSERDDDDKPSAENSRNASPKYQDTSMEDASEAGALFRVGGGAGAGGGALALSRAPVGGSASPAPAPLPQPAPSPAPAALPPPALPPPARPGGAHIPAIDGQAATQIPARPADTPERPAGNKLQPGARAAADSPTPAPPAPPAPSPLFPSHSAHQAHAGALPDYRHTNHETRTEPAEPPPAPLDLHAARAPPKPPPHALFPCGPPAAAAAPVSAPSCLPSQPPPGQPASPAALPAPAPPPPLPRSHPHPYPAPPIGSSHLNSSISSSIHNSHSIPYQSQSSLQKHSVHSVYASRPPHLAPFSVPNHVVPLTTNQTTATHLSHPINSHSIMNHTSHLPMNHSTSLAASMPNHIGAPPPLASTATTMVSGFASSLKPHPGLMAPTAGPVDAAPPSSVGLAPPAVDARLAPPAVDTRLAPPAVDARLAPPAVDSRLAPPAVDARLAAPLDPPRPDAANGYPPPYSAVAYPPLYAPYASTLQHSPYLPPAAASPRINTDTRTSLSSSPLVAPKTPKNARPHTPGSIGSARPHTPPRERESFSVSSLSRGAPSASSAAPLPAPLPAPLAAPLATPLATGLGAPLPLPLGVGGLCGLAAPTPTPAAPTPGPAALPHAHSLAPVPTVPSISSSAKPPAHWGVTRPTSSERGAFAPAPAPAPPLFAPPLAPTNPNPFSAESLFQTSPGADLLRRELDSRFLAAAGAASAGSAAVSAARTEMHHHQHQHTHVHQHPPPTHHPAHPAPPIHPAPPHPHHLIMPHTPMFKDVSKMPSLYRSSLGLGYPYSSSLLHPTAPYVPPAPLTSYAPKPVVSAASDPASKPPPRPAVAKTGKWNAMHVRIAWEIYNHQQKEKAGGASATSGASASSLPSADKDKLRSFPPPAPPPPFRSPYDLPPSPYLPHHPHLANMGVSPFARYGAGAYPGSPFGLSAYGRELALSSLHGAHHPPLLHDAWRVRPPPVPVSHAAAADAARREHEERERARRERDERERRDREERERRKQRERELERTRTRSPLRNGAPEPPKEERKEAPRMLSTGGAPVGTGAGMGLAGYGSPWDPYRAFDPLQHMRFAPLVEAAIRAEEDRHKMLSAYAHHQQLKGPLLHRPLPPHPHLAPPHMAHAPLAPLPPLAPSLAPLAPLDLLKKEEPR